MISKVAILILLELTLQFLMSLFVVEIALSRNPYFIGINSAMAFMEVERLRDLESQSLFYWN